MVVLREQFGSSSTDEPIDDRCDVFLSFRGADTRNSFTDHLYLKLIGEGISTFRDNELEKGEALKQQLDKAIEESSVSIIIFSKDYASSSWCLNEVVRILEQKKLRSNHKVLPIFYHLEVSDVRFQKRSYEKAFHRHIEKGYVSLEKIEAWKAALREAADLSGFALNKDKGEPETEFIDRIVLEVEKNLPNRKALYVREGLVGMNDRVTGIESWLTDRSKDNKILVICGIGGIGTTTIAMHLFNKYFREFEGSCFLARITTTWAQEGVCVLQSQLLSDIRNEKIRIDNSDKGTLKIRRAICSRKVIVVLDDVSEIGQFEALLGQPQSLYPGSKILVTTRNMSLKKYLTVETKVYKIGGLNDDHSLKLFSLHAFRRSHPPKEYEQLSKEILQRCEGHPLALKVLGSALYKEDIVFWELQMKKWNNVADDKIQKVMQISYDSLKDDMVKNLFLHVACFFVEEEEDFVVKILDHCGLHPTVGIRDLIRRCLITIYDKKVMMHKVIQDMGQEIVRQEYPNEPGKRSRLWYHEDSFNVLKYDKGSEAVQGFILDRQKINKADSARSIFAANDANSHLMTRPLGRFLPSEEGEMRIDAFAKMVNLKFLKLHHVHLTGHCNNFPKELRWISWHRFPLEYVPMELHLENLVALDLQHSILKQVWKGYMEVKSLKFLNLSYSLELCQTPDFRGLLQLEKLILRGCSNLVTVCRTIGILKRFVSLDLSDCKSLRDLPDLPESLLSLNLSGCSLLGEFSGKQQNIKPSYRTPREMSGVTEACSFLPPCSSSSNLSLSLPSSSCRPYSLAEINKATNNFDVKNVIGEGGEGKVYLAEIHLNSNTEKTLVAVKHLKRDSTVFMKEILIVTKMQHPNLVSLLGYCDESDEKILIYEYMGNGSLSDYVKTRSATSLSWNDRLKICLGVAYGLQYLHKETPDFPKGIIHRDVKPANILLDHNWVAKVSDFGLFKQSSSDQTKSTIVTEHVKGTRGYLAPEHLYSNQLTRKTDVYAFGMVMFEVLCQKKFWDRGDISYYQEKNEDLGIWAKENVDINIKGEILEISLEMFTDTIGACLQHDPHKRPTMDEVVLKLEATLKYKDLKQRNFFEIIKHFMPCFNC